MKLCKISLMSLMFVCATNMAADARINVRNNSASPASRSQIFSAQQHAALAHNPNLVATTTSATTNLPVEVEDPELEQSIINNTAETVNTSDLENCSMIYPNGLFKWAVPEAGVRRTPAAQCVAVVELRDANTNAVLAQTTLASGDIMRCNIDMFPQSGWTNALSNVELPADDAPTLADVEQVMNQEQKQNAGLKIAAAAILTGVAGNMLAPKAAGDTKLLGTSKDQLIDTAIGAAAGASIMAASTYSGKVAGDTIKSTAVNAATGAVVGNMAGGMAGGGESTLSIKKCSTRTVDENKNIVESKEQFDCVAGTIDIRDAKNTFTNYVHTQGDAKYVYLFGRQNNDIKKCKECSGTECNSPNDSETLVFNGSTYQCRETARLLEIKLTSVDKWDDLFGDKEHPHRPEELVAFTHLDDGDGKHKFEPTTVTTPKAMGDDTYFMVYSASMPSGNSHHGYAVFNQPLAKKFFGYKVKDWTEIQTANKPTYYARNRDGSVGPQESADPANIIFTPSSVDAENDVLVDFSNKGRMKSTLSGAAAGGALGGFAGYQGAKQEVQERWLAATREYNDSLDTVYCATGTRYLSSYNSYVEIPSLPTKSE